MAMLRFSCVNCAHITESSDLDPSCLRCGSAVMLESHVRTGVRRDELEALPPGVWRYRALLPSVNPERLVTLGEGGTLCSARRGSAGSSV